MLYSKFYFFKMFYIKLMNVSNCFKRNFIYPDLILYLLIHLQSSTYFLPNVTRHAQTQLETN
jgi:hypothetical protein